MKFSQKWDFLRNFRDKFSWVVFWWRFNGVLGGTMKLLEIQVHKKSSFAFLITRAVICIPRGFSIWHRRLWHQGLDSKAPCLWHTHCTKDLVRYFLPKRTEISIQFQWREPQSIGTLWHVSLAQKGRKKHKSYHLHPYDHDLSTPSRLDFSYGEPKGHDIHTQIHHKQRISTTNSWNFFETKSALHIQKVN